MVRVMVREVAAVGEVAVMRVGARAEVAVVREVVRLIAMVKVVVAVVVSVVVRVRVRRVRKVAARLHHARRGTVDVRVAAIEGQHAGARALDVRVHRRREQGRGGWPEALAAEAARVVVAAR